ncbi:MAG: hypothetical protein M5R36_25785 [Deltaproteobacteria bacterium]|nr:hypothetical protein [Deltaproteobacteria bacterium]
MSPAYIRFIQDTVVDLVLDTWTRLRPVTMRAALVPIDDPQSNERTLIADFREPRVTVPYLAAARFDADDGAPVATLVNWHSHPEVMIESTLVSADFPRWVRERVEQTTGGRAVYLSGAVGGLSSPTGVAVPARGEDGEPVHDDNGNAVYLVDGTWDKTRSLGFVIADLATNALDEALPIDAPSLFVHVEELPLPVRNPLMKAAFAVGLIEYDLADRVRLPECGWFGCLAERLALVRVGPVEIVSSPGEIFPETMIGREAETIDFGEGFGPFDFPAVAGYLEDSGAPVPMHMGLCGDEMGYLIPETDFHPRDHPDYYEEDLILGTDTETLYRDAVVRVLTAQGG